MQSSPEDWLIVVKDPDSLVAESYRSLRTKLSTDISHGLRSLMVVSTRSGEGKSMVAANLAASLTQLYFKVILIDGDLRRPSLTRLFGCEDIVGFTNYLEGNTLLSEAIYSTSIDKLSILPAGTSKSNPANLLGRHLLPEAIAELRERGYFLIFDTPPITACSDAILIGTQVDGALMVVNPSTWQGDSEVKVTKELKAHDIEIVGAILNGASESEQEHSGYKDYQTTGDYAVQEQAQKSIKADQGPFDKAMQWLQEQLGG